MGLVRDTYQGTFDIEAVFYQEMLASELENVNVPSKLKVHAFELREK